MTGPPNVRHLLLIATAANTLGITAHMTYMYYLAPIALRASGILGRDAVIFSLVAIAMGAAVVPAGRLADRIPRRYVMRAGLALLAVAYAGLVLPGGLVTVALGTAASGIGLGLLFVSFTSYVADLLASGERTMAYGRAGAFAVLASAVGPFLAALVFRAAPTERFGLAANAALFGVAGLGAIALSMALPSIRAPSVPAHERGRWYEAARAAGPAALTYVFMGAGYGMTAPYFTVYFLDTLDLARSHWGYLLAAGTVASALGSMIAGEIGRRTSPTRVALLGMLGLVLSTLPFALGATLLGLAAGFILRSFFSTTVAPGMHTLTMERARPGRRAEASAYTSVAWNVGWATGGALGGLALSALGGAAFVAGSALALLGVALGMLVLRRP